MAGQVTWASAGHDPPIVFDPRGDEFRELEGGDLPLGLTEDVEYAEYRGAAVLPGFNDAHVHFLATGRQLASVNLRDAKTPEEFVRRIKDFASKQPKGISLDTPSPNAIGNWPVRAIVARA